MVQSHAAPLAADQTAARAPRLVVGAVLVAVVAAAALAAFVWPSARLAPRELPLAIAGPAPEAEAIADRVARRGEAFDLHRYADDAAARRAIRDRRVYGALVVSPEGTTLLTASAASPVVAELLEAAFASRERIPVVDVLPADPDDPRGVALTSLVLPLTLVGVLAGVLSTVLTPPGRTRALALGGAALLAGAVAIATVEGWLGIVPGDAWRSAAVLALLVLAIASLVSGVAGLLGSPGLVLAVALLVVCGNPWSAMATAPELLPRWVGLTGQLLPPGAGGTLLRSTAFFDGGGTARPLTVLVAWAVLGLGAVAAAALRRRPVSSEAEVLMNEARRPRDEAGRVPVLARVLVGVDGSDESLEAARQAVTLAEPGRPPTLLAVYDVAPAIVGGTGSRAPRYFDEGFQRERAQDALDRTRRALAGGAETIGKLARGNAWDELIREAAGERFTLLAVGSHGAGRVRGILAGSTATEVIHKAPCSVLVAREADDEFPRRIVVGVDGSIQSAAALAVARGLAERFGAELSAVVAHGGRGVDERMAATIAGPRREDVPDKPVDALTAASASADLLVVGSRGLHGLESLGSVSERVAHQARCSVLVIREPRWQQENEERP